MAEHLLDVACEGRSIPHSRAASTGGGKETAGPNAKERIHFFLIQELSIFSHKLKPIPLGRIMTCRDDDPAPGVEKTDHEKNSGSRRNSDIDDAATDFPKALNDLPAKTVAARSRVLGDHHLSPFRKKGKGLGEIADPFVGKSSADDAPDS